MSDDYLDNPAGRLYSAFVEMHNASAGNPKESAWDVWVRVLAPAGTAPDSPAAFTAISRLMELPAAVRAAVDALELDAEEKLELVEDLDKIEHALRLVVQRSHPVTHVVGPFASGGNVPGSAPMRTLLVCARKLHRSAPEPRIPAGELEQFAEAITELMAQVQTSTLGQDAKLLLFHHLHALLEAIHLVRITGTVPLEDRMDAFAAALIARQPAVGTEVEADTSVFGPLKKLVRTIDTVLRGARGLRAVAHEANQLGHEGRQLLEHGAHALDQASTLLH